MNISFIPWRGITIGTAIISLILMVWGLRLDHLREGWKSLVDATLPAARLATDDPDLKARDMPGALKVLADEKRFVVRAVQGALNDSNGSKPSTVRVTWATAGEQIAVIGEGTKEIRIELNDVNQRLDQMAERAVAAEASLREKRALLVKAEQRREQLARELSEINITPERAEACLELDRQARKAANLLREAMR